MEAHAERERDTDDSDNPQRRPRLESCNEIREGVNGMEWRAKQTATTARAQNES